MPAQNPVPMPLQDAIASPRNPRTQPGKSDPNEGKITDAWLRYFQDQGQAVNESATRAGLVELSTQSASIGATDMTGGTAASGLYRINVMARITTAATVSSSLTLSFAWTDHAVAQTYSGSAITGNTTTTWQSNMFMIYSDSVSPITYATTYASVGATAMQYQLYVVLEALVT